MSKGQNDNTNYATKKFDYRAVADRLKTVSWSNYDYPTGVVNLVYGPNRPTPRNRYLVLGREGPYFVKEHSDLKSKYTEEDIIKMLEFLVDNIFVVFAERFSNR